MSFYQELKISGSYSKTTIYIHNCFITQYCYQCLLGQSLGSYHKLGMFSKECEIFEIAEE